MRARRTRKAMYMCCECMCSSMMHMDFLLRTSVKPSE